MTTPSIPIGALLDRLLWRVRLSEADKRAVLALPFTLQTLTLGESLIRQGDRPVQCCVLLSGFMVRDKFAAMGGRQILAVHVPGEVVDTQNILLESSDHNISALTAVEVLAIPRDALQALAFERPQIGKALWLETLVDASVFREWIVNVARRDGASRIAHLLCEFAIRLEKAGLAHQYAYELPMTQEQVGDAVGLTTVHVNRSLKALDATGLIARDKRAIRITNWTKLAQIADFDAAYLHLPQAGDRLE